MSVRTLEFCSLQYLNQWMLRDSGYCNALARGSEKEKLDILHDAAAFYRIARNLPRAADIDKGLPRYKPLLAVIDAVKPADFRVNPLQRIHEVESAISRRYCKRSVLSLTTKILWLKVKTPIIIYDAQARRTLGIKAGDLTSYYNAWRKVFQEKSVEISASCAELVTMSKYTVDVDLATTSYIQNVTSNRWFHERVLDLYLWNAGSNG